VNVGKAARLKEQRRVAVASLAPSSRSVDRTWLVWGSTAIVAALVAIVVGVLLATRSTNTTAPAARDTAADRHAPPALVRSADAVGFHPTTEPGVGQVEGTPASASAPPSNPDLLPVGSRAPAFSLRTPQGAKVSLESMRGKAVLLEFFATWCPHCNAEAPHLRQLAASLPDRRYAIVGINADGEDAASVFAYHRYFGLAFPALLDPSLRPGSFHQPGAPGGVSTRYRVGGYPTFYVIDPQGRITWRSDNEQPDASLRLELARAAAHG
jgi:peroxiredoxin